MTQILPKRALISVSDKTNIEALAKTLVKFDIEILSTGGTAKALREAGIPVTNVSDVTAHPEIMGGRVKTLHPKIHGGILARRGIDEAELAAHGIGEIDIVIVNLYPFEATVEAGASYEEIVENIDIGGPAMIRAAAKNHAFVTIITDAQDYMALAKELEGNQGQVGLPFRQKMAGIAYGRTASYDAHIANWIALEQKEKFPRRLTQSALLASTLRYGENPHQEAALYKTAENGFANAQILQGKALSYNNINDANAALALIGEFDVPACAIIKHANPCGVAIGSNLIEAYQKALACDPVSAFGGIIAVNQPITGALAQEITQLFTEVVIAPAVDEEAIEIFSKKPNLRLMLQDPGQIERAKVEVLGGWLVQDADYAYDDESLFEAVTERKPSAQEMQDLLLAWKIAKHVKSNAIVYVKDGRTVGIGAGQMSRVDSARIAARKAMDMEEASNGAPTLGSVVASDAFFPFADGLLQAAEAGATAIIQPGGSMRDDDVIKAANDAGLAMVFTHRRHFRH